MFSWSTAVTMDQTNLQTYHVLLSDHVGTSFTSNPDFMNTASIDIDAVSHAISCFLWLFVFRVGDGQLTM
jgi:hypothetical protein